ncbi:MAG: hypothetical protein IPO26_20125 [Saprospiraceae bacterium]|nr:hypothetical protein [Saprospiraceae bacterium]
MPSCGLTNGNIDLSVTPTGIYTFSWSNGATFEDISNLSAGTYIVTVTGSNGCTATLSTTVNNINLSFAITSNIAQYILCDTKWRDRRKRNTNRNLYLCLEQWRNFPTQQSDGLDLTQIIVTDATSCSSSGDFYS